MKAPKLWRKKRANGKLYGSWHVTLGGADVNLGTSDANEATARRAQALRGKRKFADELDEAAAAVDGLSGGAAGGAAPIDDAAGPAASTTPPIVPDAILPPARQLPAAPSPDDARAEAEATNAAAAELGGGGPAANDNADPPSPFPEGFLDELLANGALVLVDLQIGLQGYCIKRGLKVQPGAVPPDDPFRKAASQSWAAQLKLWFPSVQALPPWGAALLLPLACAKAQLEGCTPLPKEGEEPQENPAEQPAQAAA